MNKFWHPTNYRRGHFCEKIALLWLILRGYWPVKMNYRVGNGTGAGEVDLIVKKGNVLVFVEVKLRKDEASAQHAVHKKNQHRMTRTAEVFLSRFPKYQNYSIRYDVVLLSKGHWPQHLTDAWHPF